MGRSPPSTFSPPLLPLLLALGCVPVTHADVPVPYNFRRKTDAVPKSFMGFSVEPLSQAKHYGNKPSFVNLLKNLANFSTGQLVIRWGGAAMDMINTPYDDATWETLAMLSREAGVVHIIGLRLLDKPIDLAVTQVSNAMKILKPETVLGFEIGNEPNNFPKWYGQERYEWRYETKSWFNDQNEFYRALEPLFNKYFGTTKKIAGPAMAGLHFWRVGDINRWLTGGLSRKFASIATAHWYAGIQSWPGMDIDLILSLEKMESISNYTEYWAATSHEKGATFRMGETNSLAQGGKYGVSDTLGAAVFIVEYSMTLIMSGTDGVNFHNVPCAPYSAIVLPYTEMVCEGDFATCNMVCERGPDPVAGATYYGTWMVQKALAGNPNIASDVVKVTVLGESEDSVKAYAFNTSAAEIRVMLIKKNGTEEATFRVEIPGLYGTAKMELLHSPKNKTMRAQLPDIVLSGQTIDGTGQIVGQYMPQAIAVTQADGVSRYTFQVPAASAALLVISPESASPISSPLASSSPSMSPSPSPAASPSPSPAASPSPSPAASPSPSPAASPSPSPAASLSPSPAASPSPSPDTSPSPSPAASPSPAPLPLPSPSPAPLPSPSPVPSTRPSLVIGNSPASTGSDDTLPWGVYNYLEPPGADNDRSPLIKRSPPPFTSPTVLPSPVPSPSPSGTLLPSPRPPPPSTVPSRPTAATHQVVIVTPMNDNNGANEASIARYKCLKLKSALASSLQAMGIDPSSAFFDTNAAMGCSVVSEAAGRVYYKILVALMPSEFSTLSLGMYGGTFASQADLLCGSSLQMGEAGMAASVIINTSRLGTLAADGECKRKVEE